MDLIQGQDNLIEIFWRTPGWNLAPQFGLGLLVAEVGTIRDAEKIVLRYTDRLAAMAQKLNFEGAIVRHIGLAPGTHDFYIPARMATLEEGPVNSEVMRDRDITMNDQQLSLVGADYRRILEFLLQKKDEGRIVIITSNTTNICLHTNDLLLPARGVLSAAQFTGYNYLRSWRADRSEDPNNPQRLNPQFDQLRDLLARDGHVPGFRYTLYRPDEALCEYSTDYYLCRDYCGDEVRIGVSRTEDWRLLQTA